MRAHYFQHVEFEGLGDIQSILERQGCQLSATRWYAGDKAPIHDDYDLLVVMGGPMGIYDYDEYPWLVAEKRAIKAAIAAGKKVLGICLGAQLIADTLGASVGKNPQREIGWFSVESNAALNTTRLANVFPSEFEPLHWHGDTFALPEHAIALGRSEACTNQGFIFDDRVIALQFHLELNAEGVSALCDACSDELDGSKFVQNPDDMLDAKENFSAANNILVKLIGAIV